VDPEALVAKARAIPKMEGADLVKDVTCDSAFAWRDRFTASQEAEQREFGVGPERRAKRRLTVAAYDFGVKYNILRRLDAYGCDVHVFPAKAPASELLALNPDGVFLSNGPGDPAVLDYAIANVKTLVDSGLRLAVPAAAGGSWHDFTGATDDDRIDHILVTKEWTVTEAAVSHYRPDGRVPSDHWPLFATLELQ